MGGGAGGGGITLYKQLLRTQDAIRGRSAGSSGYIGGSAGTTAPGGPNGVLLHCVGCGDASSLAGVCTTCSLPFVSEALIHRVSSDASSDTSLPRPPGWPKVAGVVACILTICGLLSFSMTSHYLVLLFFSSPMIGTLVGLAVHAFFTARWRKRALRLRPPRTMSTIAASAGVTAVRGRVRALESVSETASAVAIGGSMGSATGRFLIEDETGALFVEDEPLRIVGPKAGRPVALEDGDAVVAVGRVVPRSTHDLQGYRGGSQACALTADGAAPVTLFTASRNCAPRVRVNAARNHGAASPASVRGCATGLRAEAAACSTPDGDEELIAAHR